MNNTILEFESKMKIVGGEKVFSGREIMNLCGYDKWERFEGAVLRAIEDNKKEIVDRNIFLKVEKYTGGRPKKDYLLTLGGCFLVLNKCDKRKQEVSILIDYLDDLIKEKKLIKKQKISFLNKYKYYVFGGILFFLFCFFMGLFYFNFTYLKTQDKTNFSYPYDFIKNFKQTHISTPQEVPKNQEKQAQTTKTIQNKLPKNNILQDIKDYTKTPGEKVFFINKNINYRNNFTKDLKGENLIISYFFLGNYGFYRDSCSLLSKNDCLSSSKSDLKNFGNFWEKTKNGYEIISIKKVQTNDTQNVYCVNYKYKLKNDLSQNYIQETFNYTTQNIGNYEEITQRYCEKIQKGDKKINCPFKLKKYYCE